MKIFENFSNFDREQNHEKTSINEIINHISMLCKDDKNFGISKKINLIEYEIKEMREKIENKNLLLSESGKLKNDIKKRISEIQKINLDNTSNLLNRLGIES